MLSVAKLLKYYTKFAAPGGKNTKLYNELQKGNLSENQYLEIQNQNSKKSIELLKAYYNKGYYVRFTDDPKKLSINIKQDWGTPFGTCSYLLNSTLISNFVTFAKHREYIQICNYYGNKLDCQNYSNEQFENDILKLHKHFDFDEHFVEELKKEAIHNIPISWMFHVTRKLANDNSKEWSKILVDILGYDYIEDDGGGIIHGNEPAQAIALCNSKSAPKINLIAVVHNVIDEFENELIDDDDTIKIIAEKMKNCENIFENKDYYSFKENMLIKLFDLLFDTLTYDVLYTYGFKISILCEKDFRLCEKMRAFFNKLSDEQILELCFVHDFYPPIVINKLTDIAEKITKDYQFNATIGFDLSFDNIIFVLDNYLGNEAWWNNKKKTELFV